MKKKILLVLPRNYEINFINISGIIKIIDEDVEDIDFKESFDIVGIGGFSCYLNRAEIIAREFSKKGALIVCGGSPVTFSAERWRAFADVLIIGEAERSWTRFKDYAPRTLKKYLYGIIQISRGCPFTCEFCSVHEYAGNRMRYKAIDKIIKEVEQLYTVCKSRIILIADDNFTGNKKSAKEVLKALKNWNQSKIFPVSFVTQLSVDAAIDVEFLELAAEAGLIRVSVGIETPNLESLKETHKLQNLQRNTHEDIKRFNEHGILVQAGCIVGFDHDDKSIFKSQFDFFNNLGIPNIQVMPLHAPDGSPLKRRMIKEGRYIDWEPTARANPEQVNSLNTFTIVPKQMTLEELRQGMCWLLKNLYKPENFIHRMKIFFMNYENSQKRQTLHIPKARLEWYGAGLVVRLFKYVQSSQKIQSSP